MSVFSGHERPQGSDIAIRAALRLSDTRPTARGGYTFGERTIAAKNDVLLIVDVRYGPLADMPTPIKNRSLSR